MLQDLVEILANNDLNFVEEICNLKSSCCSSSKQVLDFDLIKDEFCKKNSIGNIPKSCDALLIDVLEDKITFIEMKELISIFDEIKSKGYNLEEAKNRIEYAFKVEFSADKKILDSLMLLLDISIKCGINNDFFPYFLSEDCSKAFYFVLGCSPRDFVRYSLSILPLRYKYEYFKLGQTKFIPASNFDQVFSS